MGLLSFDTPITAKPTSTFGLQLSKKWVKRGLRAVYLPSGVISANGFNKYNNFTKTQDGNIATATAGIISPTGNAMGQGKSSSYMGISNWGNTFFVIANLNSVTGLDCIALGRARYESSVQVGCTLRFDGNANNNLGLGWAYYEYWWAYAYWDFGVITGRHSYAGSVKALANPNTVGLYRDGVRYAPSGSSYGGGTAYIEAYDYAMDIGKTSAFNETVIVNGIDGGIEFGAHFGCKSQDDDVLTDKEILEIHNNPYCLLEPRFNILPRSIIILPSGKISSLRLNQSVARSSYY